MTSLSAFSVAVTAWSITGTVVLVLIIKMVVDIVFCLIEETKVIILVVQYYLTSAILIAQREVI